MIETATVNGRPAIVAYIGHNHEPVTADEAELIKVNFTDEEGGIVFLVGPARDRKPEKSARVFIEKASPHKEWMDECVPNLMDMGKDQIVAVAACLNMWRDAWREAHPDKPDPGPPPPEPTPPPDLTSEDEEWRRQQRRRWKAIRAQAEATLARVKYDPNQPRDEDGKWTDDGGGDDGDGEDNGGDDGAESPRRVWDGKGPATFQITGIKDEESGEPRRVEARADAKTKALADELAGHFPKSVKVSSGNILRHDKGPKGFVKLRVELTPNKVTGEINETGLKRYKAFLKAIEKKGHEIRYDRGSWVESQSFGSLKELHDAIGIDDDKKKKAWQRAKAEAERLLGRVALLEKDKDDYIQDPKTGKLQGRKPGGGHGGGTPKDDPTSAEHLMPDGPEVEHVDEIYDRVPGAREQAAEARAKLSMAVPTDAATSLGGHKLPDGSWTPERQAAHFKIEAELMSDEQIAAAVPKPGEKPVVYLLGGRGGSGKGWLTRPKSGGPIDPSASVYINSDDVKSALPGYGGWNAGLLHEESSYIAERMEAVALRGKLNTILDITMKSEASVSRRIKAFKEAGYEIRGYYMHASPATAAKRALERFVGGNAEDGKGRFVPPEYTLHSLSNEHNFDSHRKDMDHWEVYDNNGDAPKLHSKKGD